MSVLLNYELYSQNRKLIDRTCLILALSNPVHYTHLVALELKELGIGDATSDDHLALAYSTTGAAARTARRELYQRKYISVDWESSQHPVSLTEAGRQYLQTLINEDEA